MDGQKAQLDIKNHDGEMKKLVIVLIRSREWKQENISKLKYRESKNKTRRAVRPNVKKKGKNRKCYVE